MVWGINEVKINPLPIHSSYCVCDVDILLIEMFCSLLCYLTGCKISIFVLFQQKNKVLILCFLFFRKLKVIIQKQQTYKLFQFKT